MLRTILGMAFAGAIATTAWADQPASCGKKGLPDCPMQAMMKAQVQANLRTGDLARLAAALDRLAEHPPATYVGWAESAKQGAAAARAGDTAGVRASCKSCHDTLRVRYREELRAAVVP